jgi:hypothetical protein
VAEETTPAVEAVSETAVVEAGKTSKWLTENGFGHEVTTASRFSAPTIQALAATW